MSANGDRPQTVGERVRALRLERRLSQREIAGPGCSYAYISRIEAGGRTPSVKALRTLAAKLGVTPHYLETGAPDPAEAILEELHILVAHRAETLGYLARCVEDGEPVDAEHAAGLLGGVLEVERAAFRREREALLARLDAVEAEAAAVREAVLPKVAVQ